MRVENSTGKCTSGMDKFGSKGNTAGNTATEEMNSRVGHKPRVARDVKNAVVVHPLFSITSRVVFNAACPKELQPPQDRVWIKIVCGHKEGVEGL